MKNNKGITLIALVVTIIVLLILAGVSIAMLSGENGILSKASSAGDETKIAAAKETAGVDLSAVIADYYEQKYVNNTAPYSGTLLAYIQNNWTSSDTTQYTVSSGSVTIVPKASDGKTWTGSVDANGVLTWSLSSN